MDELTETGSLMRMGSSMKTLLETPGPTAWGAGGELDMHAADEATEKALDSLLANELLRT